METKAFINSRPLTVETLIDVNNEISLSPSHLLILKTDVILSPPGTFSKPDIYSKIWQFVQHIASDLFSNKTQCAQG